MDPDNKRNTLFPGSGGQAPLSSFEDEDRTPPNPAPRDHQPATVLEGSPWDLYRTAFRLELGGSVAVVQKQPATKELFTIRSFSGRRAQEKITLIRELRHKNLLISYNIFSFEGVFFVTSEFMAISLDELTVARPDELQLATIIHQILEGISFLVSQNVTHGAITCSNILLSSKGEVKIANPECCRRSTQSDNSEDIVALGQVMKQLMERSHEEGVLGLQRPNDWSEEAVDFLSMTLSASPKQLAQHQFLIDQPQIAELVWLVSLAQVSACRFYSFQRS